MKLKKFLPGTEDKLEIFLILPKNDKNSNKEMLLFFSKKITKVKQFLTQELYVSPL